MRGAAGFVLMVGVLDGLSGERVLEFEGGDGEPVEGEHYVDTLERVGGAVVDLAGDGEAVLRKAGGDFGRETVGGGELGHGDVLAIELEAVAEDVEHAAMRVTEGGGQQR